MSDYTIEPVIKGSKTYYRLTNPHGLIVHDHVSIETAEDQKKQLEAFGYHLKDNIEEPI